MKNEPFSPTELRAAFDAIDKQPLRAHTMFITQQDWDDINSVECTKCGGMHFKDRPHTQEQCDEHRVNEVMGT